MRFYFVIREIMVIFAHEFERQLIIELHFSTKKWNFNLLLITNKIKTKKLKLSNMAKIVTLGEIMLRLSPEGNDRFIQSESLRIIPGGGEANVC